MCFNLVPSSSQENVKPKHLTEDEVLISYSIKDRDIRNTITKTKKQKWRTYLNDKTEHREIWNIFKEIIPNDKFQLIEEFKIFSGEIGEYPRVHMQPIQDSKNWILWVNVMQSKDRIELINNLIYEISSVFFINSKQLQTTKTKGCKTYTFENIGCTTKSSYMNQFYEQFWKKLNNRKTKISPEEYYLLNMDKFLNQDTMIDQTTDMTESFSEFMFTKTFASTNEKDKKIEFFYKYPELIEFRENLLKKLDNYLEKSYD